MRSLSDARHAVQTADDLDWPFRIADLARHLETELGRPDVLVEVADRLVTIAKDYGCEAITGASRVGGELAGAVVARSANGLRLFSADDPADSVLVVDGVLATGAQLVRAVMAAKDAGAKRAVAVAVLANREAIDICREEIQGNVVALDEF